MSEVDATDLKAVLEQIRAQADSENLRITQHAQQEMVEEDITLDEVLEVISIGQILENYPVHRRGACCLLSGVTRGGRPMHNMIIITVYQPKPPKWTTPTQRRNKE